MSSGVAISSANWPVARVPGGEIAWWEFDFTLCINRRDIPVSSTQRSLAMSLTQLIYASTPFGFDMQTLKGILTTARHNNARDDITGALICRGDLYLQMLEGPRAAVTRRFHKIMADDRHTNVSLISYRDAQARMFGDWHMLDDPARSWMWNQTQIAAGAMDRASEGEVQAVFTRLRREL
jgi:predicted metal-dependent HD superfamily phosphohydrolase